MNTDIPIIYQDVDECGVACFKMCLAHFNVSYDHATLLNEISNGSLKGGDWYFRIGLAALKRGLNPTIITRSIRLIDPTWYGYSQTEITYKLEQRLIYLETLGEDKKWEVEEHIQAINYIKMGGLLEFKSLSPKVVIENLETGALVIAPINANLAIPNLQRRLSSAPDDIKGEKIGHVVLVKGYTDTSFIVNDPGGLEMRLTKNYEYEILKEDLIEAVLRGDMHVLCIND